MMEKFLIERSLARGYVLRVHPILVELEMIRRLQAPEVGYLRETLLPFWAKLITTIRE
jgi:hypothetical protein